MWGRMFIVGHEQTRSIVVQHSHNCCENRICPIHTTTGIVRFVPWCTTVYNKSAVVQQHVSIYLEFVVRLSCNKSGVVQKHVSIYLEFVVRLSCDCWTNVVQYILVIWKPGLSRGVAYWDSIALFCCGQTKKKFKKDIVISMSELFWVYLIFRQYYMFFFLVSSCRQ